MSNYRYAIKKLNTKSWIKYWIWKNRGSVQKYIFKLSNILENNNYYLENTINRKFNIFEIFGNSFQNGIPSIENFVSIQNIKDEKIQIKVQNANLLNFEEYLKVNCEYTKNEDGSFTFTPNNYNEGLKVFLPFNARYSYRIINGTGKNFRLRFVYEDGYIADGTGSGVENEEIIINNAPLQNHGNIIEIRGDWSIKGTFIIKEFMYNRGNITLPYIVAKAQVINFPLQNGQILADKDFLSDDGIHHVRGRSILDGVTVGKRFVYLGNTTNNRANITIAEAKKGINYNQHNDLCTHFEYKNSVYGDSQNEVGFCGSTSGTFYFRFGSTSEIDTLEKANQWLEQQYNNETPLELQYDLENEIIEKYTEEQQIEYNKIKELFTYNNITNISSDNQLPPKIKIQYWERVEK